MMTDRPQLSPRVYQDFGYYVLDDLAERKADSGEKLQRGRRRIQNSNGKSSPVYLVGKHICYQGRVRFRGSDFSLRISLAVRALERSGQFNNSEASEAVAKHPMVKLCLGSSNRRPSRTSLDKGNSVARRTQTVRQMVFKFIERDRHYFGAQFRSWFNRFRANFAADSMFYSERIEDALENLVETEKAHGPLHPLTARWHCLLALDYHTQKVYARALFHHKRALMIMESNRKLTKQHQFLLPRLSTVKRNISACERNLSPVSEKARIVS